MRGLRSFASVLGLAAAAAYATPLTSRFAGVGPIILGGGSGSRALDDADRRRRNEAAGGRDKRIKANKARGSLPPRRRRTPRLPALSNPFTKQARKDRFDAAIAAGETRNMAMKLARRVTA
jgi:hypothetical protein